MQIRRFGSHCAGAWQEDDTQLPPRGAVATQISTEHLPALHA
jgi:hypothetical protein